MQVPNAIIFVAAEIIIVLLVCTVIFFVHSRNWNLSFAANKKNY